MSLLRHARGSNRFRTSPPAVSKSRAVVVACACLIPVGAALVASHATRLAAVPATPPAHAHVVLADAVVVAPTPAVVVAPAPAPAVVAAPAPVVTHVAPPPPKPQPPAIVHTDDTLQEGEALSSALARHDVGAEDISALMRALKGKLDARSVRAGLAFGLDVKHDEGLTRFELQTTSPEGVPRTVRAIRLEKAITADDDTTAFNIKIEDAPIEMKVEGVSGAVKSSLYEAMLDQGEDANLVNRFVDVFAWNIDFYKQTREGDEFKVLVEKKYAGGKFLGYGKVLAAEYVNAGAVYRGFKFESKDGNMSGTFDESGDGLRKAFLKAPLEITRVTSHYGQRLDPFGKGEGFHHGIDYAAPLGTPIWTTADGTIEMAKLNGGAGNMVKIKHMNGFETEYFHMTRFAEGIKQGAHVKQKQVIGYVGSTGYSTGPHLHYGMFKNGEHVDPSRQKLPNEAPVPKQYQAEYKAFVAPLLEQLTKLDRA